MHHLQQKNSREMTHLTTERHLAQNLHPTEKNNGDLNTDVLAQLGS
jgi:hypothetical protein